MSTRSTKSALGWWGQANIIWWILPCVIPYSCLTLNVSTTGQRNYLGQLVRNDQLLSDSHCLPCCQGFKQHLLFDLGSVSESGLKKKKLHWENNQSIILFNKNECLWLKTAGSCWRRPPYSLWKPNLQTALCSCTSSSSETTGSTSGL